MRAWRATGLARRGRSTGRAARRRSRRGARRRGRGPRRALEVALARGGEERVDDLALGVEVGVGNGALAAHAAAGAAGELAGRLGGAVDDRRDLVERARRRCRAARTRAARRGSASRAPRAARGPTESASSASCSGSVPSARSTIGSGRCALERLLAPRSGASAACSAQTRATTVVSQRAEVLDLVRVGAAEPQPGLLDGVVGLAQRAEHPVGDGAQAGRCSSKRSASQSRSSIGHSPPLASGQSRRPVSSERM